MKVLPILNWAKPSLLKYHPHSVYITIDYLKCYRIHSLYTLQVCKVRKGAFLLEKNAISKFIHPYADEMCILSLCCVNKVECQCIRKKMQFNVSQQMDEKLKLFHLWLNMSGRLLHAGSALTFTPPTPVRCWNFTSHPTGPQEPITRLRCLSVKPPLSWAKINNALVSFLLQ
jgi:hypothetical protein